MPGHAPAETFRVPAFTKLTAHGAPCTEFSVPGIAFKTTQPPVYTNPTADAATKIAIGESGLIVYTGECWIDDFDEANTDLGEAVYINPVGNALTLTAAAGLLPFGRIVDIEVRTGPDRLCISLDLRDTIPTYVAP